MNPVDRIRQGAARLLDHIRGEHQRQYQREQSTPNGQIRQADDPDRVLYEQHARVQREIQQQRQEQAQRDAAQREGL